MPHAGNPRGAVWGVLLCEADYFLVWPGRAALSRRNRRSHRWGDSEVEVLTSVFQPLWEWAFDHDTRRGRVLPFAVELPLPQEG